MHKLQIVNVETGSPQKKKKIVRISVSDHDTMMHYR